MKTCGNSDATAAAMAATARKFAPPVVFSALFAALSGGHSTSPPSMLETEMMRIVGSERRMTRMRLVISSSSPGADQHGWLLYVLLSSGAVHG